VAPEVGPGWLSRGRATGAETGWAAPRSRKLGHEFKDLALPRSKGLGRTAVMQPCNMLWWPRIVGARTRPARPAPGAGLALGPNRAFMGAMPQVPPHRWPLLGALLGALVGPFDGLFFALLGVEMLADGQDVKLPIIMFYAISFSVTGWLIGRVALQKRQLREHLLALAESRARAAENEKLATLGRLAAGVAHEVRNPLAVIKSATALLAEAVPPEDAALTTAAGFVEAEITRLDGFISALLDFARPQNTPRSVVPAAQVMMRLAPLATSDAAARGVHIELADEAPTAQAALDVDSLTQALFALVVNAGQAVGAGGRVRITLRAGPTFEVAGDGPGVPESDAPRIFEPFFTTRARGTGLGLAMASRITEAHGGRLELVPGGGLGPAGRGACFRILLSNQGVGS